MTIIETQPAPHFPDLTKSEVIQTMQMARRMITNEEEEFVCFALATAHLRLNHERRWENACAHNSSLPKWVQSLLENNLSADSWLIAKAVILTDEEMRKWRIQWLTLLISYVIQLPKSHFKTPLPTP